MDYAQEDCKAIWSNIQYNEEQLKLKRRWLMGLASTSKSDIKQSKKILEDGFLPESLLREDDVSYEIVRTSVERGFRKPDGEREHDVVQDPGDFRKTCVELRNTHHSNVNKILERLKEMSYQTLSAMRRKLEDISGDPPQIHPPKSGGGNRTPLVNFVRNKCTKLLSEVNEGDELQETLAKAMAVAVLSLKVQKKDPNISPDFCCFSPEIKGLQNEILKAIWLLDEMHINDSEVQDLRCLLDPKKEIYNPHFRSATQKMLIEYLFECSEMVIIPNALLESIAIITRRCTPNLAAKEDIEEEVEIVLSISSQMKQIVWDWLPDHNMDEEFAKAYMEDKLESDDDDQFLEPQIGESICSDESIGESTQDDYVLPTTSSDGRNRKGNSTEGPGPDSRNPDLGSSSRNPDLGSSSPSCQESSVPHGQQHTSANQYLAIQEICDETSLFAHQLIGRLLDEFLHIESVDIGEGMRSYLRGGLSTPEDFQASERTQTSEVDMRGSALVKVVQEMWPNFPNSGIERVKEIMGMPP